MPFNKLRPKQPDPYIVKAYQQELAKFGHLNTIVGYLNTLQNQILALVGSPIKYNLTATTDPTPDDGLLRGYSIDSIWYNTVTQTFWACLDPSFSPNPPGAIWSDQAVGQSGVLNNMTATRMPLPSDDSGDGYSINSGWYDTLTGILYFAQSVAPGLAVWAPVPSSSVSIQDITWTNLMLAQTNSTLVPNRLYRSTTAVDTSTVLTTAWVLALSTNRLAQSGVGLITSATISNRPCAVGFKYTGVAGARIAWIHDENDNYVYTADAGNNIAIARWWNLIPAAAYSIRVTGATLTASPSGTIGSGSSFDYRASLNIKNNSSFTGRLSPYSVVTLGTTSAVTITDSVIGHTATFNCLDGGGGQYYNISPGMTITVPAGVSLTRFSTFGNTTVQTGGANASGDTVTARLDTGTLIITNGATDITINLPDGLFDGQRMTIIFEVAQTATTWSANTNSSFFPASSAGPYKIQAAWEVATLKWN